MKRGWHEMLRRAGMITWLYRVGPWLRRLGLGRVVEFGRRRLSRVAVPFEAEIDGLRLSGETVAHAGYVREILGGRESFMIDLLVQSLRPGMRVADVGAYLGLITLQSARRIGPTGRVCAFEPNPEALALLKTSVRRNGFQDRVEAIPCAVSDRSGTREYFIAQGAETSALYAHEEFAKRVEVESVRLDDMFDGSACWDVVKLDIEGAEVAALTGMRKTIARSNCPLFVECNPAHLSGAGTSVAALIDSLEGLGLRIAVIDESTRSLQALSVATTLDPYVNLYCEPTGQMRSTTLIDAV
jgi:FkbM family methyltransferase